MRAGGDRHCGRHLDDERSNHDVTTTGSTTTSTGEACVEMLCNMDIRACGDCDDNDGDGLVDFEDPECSGPCDEDEDVF